MDGAARPLDFTVPSKQILTMDEYHAHPAIGSSSLKTILRSPLHYKYEREHPREATKAMDLGTAIHQAILEPNLFMANAIVMPTFSGTGMRAAKEAWTLEHHGKILLRQDDMDAIRGILHALSGHSVARQLLSGGAAEESYFWQDPETGLICKCRPDYLRKGHIILDVKSTTKSAAPDAWPRTMVDYLYHLSAAHYLEGVSIVENQSFDQFIHLAVETSAPHGVAVYLLDEGTIDAGRFLRRKALNRLKACRESGIFHGYANQIVPIAIPGWAFPMEEPNE